MASPIQQWLDETLAVIVLYNIALSNSSSFNSLTSDLEKEKASLDLFVYDNSAISKPCLEYQPWRIFYHSDNANPGVSKAYNEGFKKALSLGKKWLFLLDQDSEFPLKTFSGYATAISQNINQSVFVPKLIDRRGILSPFRFYLGNGFRTPVSNGVHSLRKLSFINSGMVLQVDVFQKANGFNEKLKLDFSDLAFIHRLKALTHSFIVVKDLVVKHAHSSLSTSSFSIALVRFEWYCSAAIQYKETEQKNLNLFLTIVPHSIKLCLQYQTIKFLSSGLNSLKQYYAQ